MRGEPTISCVCFGWLLLWSSVNFQTSTLSGHVDHSVELLGDSSVLVVDTAGGLTVSGVTEVATGSALKFAFGEGDAIFGKPLQIELPAAAQKKGAKIVVRIEYATTPEAGALQWLPPEQTKGGKYPYLFSQFVL